MNDQKPFEEIQLTHDAKGHCLNSTQCFSPDGTMLVYDSRNVDSALASNGEIRVIDIKTGEDRLVYKTENQTAFGPGVGAVTFSPVANRVLFLAGIRNADESKPYSMTRRTGFAVDLDAHASTADHLSTPEVESVPAPEIDIADEKKITVSGEKQSDDRKTLPVSALKQADDKKSLSASQVTHTDDEKSLSASGVKHADDKTDRIDVIRMDARDIVSPFTPGALRGGTHAHTWSGDGQWISFTYNDHVLHESPDEDVIDTRTVGVMFPRKTIVDGADEIENINGAMFSFLVTRVVKHPLPGSDEISRAFDECWIGGNGYILPDGSRQERAIAFQGELLDQHGNKKTEIFVADLPSDLSSRPSNDFLPGTVTTLPAVPAGVKQRRISFTEKGVSGSPRHWLRSSPDGSMIGYLAPDKQGIIQLWTISPNGGKPEQRTFLETSISGPFNFNASGTALAFIADGSVFVTRLSDSRSERVTVNDGTKGKLVGAVNWSPTENKICYNRYVKSGEQEYLQIFISDVSRAL